MNGQKPAALDSYLEDRSSATRTQYGLPVLVSAAVHLAILLAVFPQIDSALIKFKEDEHSLTFSLSLDQEQARSEPVPITSLPQEDQITTISDGNDQELVTAPVEPETEAPPTEQAETLAEDNSNVSESETSSDLALDDPNYSGNIFDPRIREKLIESQARAKRLASVAKPEPYHYVDSSGAEIIVNGDTCYRGAELDEFSGTLWSLPYRCPWVKSQAEIMIGNVNQAMRERFGRP